MAPNTKRVFYVKYVSSPLFMQILAQRPDVQLDRLENESPDDVVTPILTQAHVYQIGASRQVIAPHFQVADALLERMPNLVAVSSNGAGYDTVDVDACTRQGIAVVNQSGGNKEGVAEHALAMMLTLSKRIIETDRRMRAGPDIPRNQYIGRELLNRTVGVIGIGNVGGRVAELCRGLFKMRVLAYDPYLTAAQIAARGAEKVELDDLLRQADFVSVHCPLTRESRGMMGAAQFALMRPDAWFITTARGFIHDEQRAGRRAGREADRRCRPGCVGRRAAAARPSAAEVRQRAGQPAHRRRDRGIAREHGALRGRAGAGDTGREAAAAAGQSGSVAGLSRTLCPHHGVRSG